MKLFLKFVYQYRNIAIIFILFTAIFAGILFLYDSNTEAVLYAGGICAFIGSIVTMVHFLKFRKQHLILKEIYRDLPLTIDKLPSPNDEIQADLNKIIKRLDEIRIENFTNMKNARQDNLDYYTVWIHQIKTPIAAIQMMLNIDDSEMNREMLAELFRIEQYAQMALYYVRLDSSSTDFVIKEYCIDDIIKQAVHSYAPQFIRRKIQLIYSPSDEKILTDEKWLLFIIEQLLSNAVKYTAKGSVTIKCADSILTVSDTGIGISPEDLPRIFEKGYTGLSGRTNKKSTGLGLYLCQKAAKMLGHNISVNSQIGKGTEFSLDMSIRKIEIE